MLLSAYHNILLFGSFLLPSHVIPNLFWEKHLSRPWTGLRIAATHSQHLASLLLQAEETATDSGVHRTWSTLTTSMLEAWPRAGSECYASITRGSASEPMACVYCVHMLFQSQALERKGLENLHQYHRSRARTGNSTQEQLLCMCFGFA